MRRGLAQLGAAWLKGGKLDPSGLLEDKVEALVIRVIVPTINLPRQVPERPTQTDPTMVLLVAISVASRIISSTPALS